MSAPAAPAPEKKQGRRRHTQAVIIIHGMGEQRPMETLRSFARAILPIPEHGPQFFSRPDTLSESFELRVLQDRSQPRTHFFEYYWANKVSGTSYKHLVGWLTTLLFKRPKDVPRRLILIWVISWLLVISALIGTVTGAWSTLSSYTTDSASGVLSLVSLAILGFVQWFALYFVGDVARYLNPAPENINIRQSIRADGIQLLKKIHESGKYDRVILVGHSLGSFVAYDILRYVWQEYHEIYKKAHPSGQQALAELERLGTELCKKNSGVSIEQYRDAQLKLWKELRSLGHPWLVTDLITMGSPLTYALLLLAKNESDLHEQQSERELPISPPEPEIRDGKAVYSYEAWIDYGPERDVHLRALHTGAPFAVTRWTNFFFPGDLAGGPLAAFGCGIRNITVHSGKFLVDHTILAHTAYWDQKAMTDKANPNAIDQLKSALDLKSAGYFDLPENQDPDAGMASQPVIPKTSRKISERKVRRKK